MPKFGGGDKCTTCTKTVYASEKVTFEGLHYHDTCFKCSICQKKIENVSKAGSMDGKVSHRACFEKEMRASGGKYGGVKVVAGAKKAADAAKASGTAPAAAAAAAPKAAPKEEKKEEPKPAPAKAAVKAAPKAAKAKKEGKIDTSRTDKIFVDNYGPTQQEPVIVTIPASDKPKTGVFIGSCKGCVIKVEGKAKNITISGCQDCGIVFDECVTTVEVINSKKCQVQSIVKCGTFTLDKCDRMKVYLAGDSVKEGCLVYTSQSSASNIYYPTPDGEDMEEYGVPEQMITTFKQGEAPVTVVVIPDAE